MNEDLLTVLPETYGNVSYELLNTIINYQRAWMDFSMWFRNFIYSSIDNSPNLTAVTNQLYSTLTDLYNLFRVFYGPELSQNLYNLLLNFVTSASRVIEGINNNDTETVNSNTMLWYQSADALALFLDQINVFWGVDEWRNIFYQYIRSTIQEILLIVGGNYEQEITTYKSIEDLSYLMGSYMARGIFASTLSTQKQIQS